MAKKPTQSKKPAKVTAATGNDRNHLAGVIQAGTGCSGKAAKETFNNLLAALGASLKKNGKVQLVGFGTFMVTKRAARTGRNPRTGEPMKVKASKSVRFKPGAALKGSL